MSGHFFVLPRPWCFVFLFRSIPHTYVQPEFSRPLSPSNTATPRNSQIGQNRRDAILYGGLRRQIMLLAIPTLTQQFLTFCVGMFDTWLAGQIDAAATTAIGVSAYVGWLAGLLVSTVSIGTTALVARHCGANEPDEANQVVGVSMLVGQLLCICMSALLYLTAPLFVNSFNLTGSTQQVALNYLRLDAIGHLLTGATLVGSAALRGSGDMKRPMAVLGAISVLNMLVSVGLVYGIGPDCRIWFPVNVVGPQGVYGIAGGTVVARLAGGVIMLAVLFYGSDPIRLRLSLLKFDRSIIKRLSHLGRYAGADSIINWCGQFSFLMIIRRVFVEGVHDDAVFAAHVIGIQVEAITYLPAIAWGSAAATMIGQAMGAKKLKRAYHAGLEATLQCCLLGLVVTVIFFLGSQAIFELMHTDPQVVRVGVPAFQAMSWFQVPLMVLLVLRVALQGAGDTRWPMFATVVGIFCLRLPGAWFFGVYLQMGLLGAWTGMFLDIIFRCVLMSWRYLNAKWLSIRV